jgi:hypothetical protein
MNERNFMKTMINLTLAMGALFASTAMAVQTQKVLKCSGESRVEMNTAPGMDPQVQLLPISFSVDFFKRPEIDPKYEIAESELDLPALKVLVRASSDPTKAGIVYAIWKNASVEGKDLSLSFNSMNSESSKSGKITCKVVDKNNF